MKVSKEDIVRDKQVAFPGLANKGKIRGRPDQSIPC